MRLAAAMKAAGVTRQGELAARAGISPAHMSQILAGKKEPGRHALRDLAAALGVRAEWLATGFGEMRAPSAAPPREARSWTGDLRPCIAGTPIEDVVPLHTFDPHGETDRAWRELDADRREDVMLTLHRVAVVASFVGQVLPAPMAEKVIDELSRQARQYLESAF